MLINAARPTRTVAACLLAVTLLNLSLAAWDGRDLWPRAAMFAALVLLLAWAGRAPPAPAPGAGPGRPPGRLGDRVAALLLFALALSVRVLDLEGLPQVPTVDEGINGEVVMSILRGDGPGFLLPMGVPGEEAAVFYLHALSFRLLGPSMLSLRLPAAVAGALFTLAFFLLARRFVPLPSAAAAAALCAVDPTQVLFGRMANSIAYPPLFLALASIFLWDALREGRLRDHVWLGLALGLGLHTYPAFRIVPPLALAVLAVQAVRLVLARNWRALAGPALTVALTAAFVFPLLSKDQDARDYFGRLHSVTLFGHPARELAGHVQNALPRVLAATAGFRPVTEGYRLWGPGWVALALLGLTSLWLRRRDEGPELPRTRLFERYDDLTGNASLALAGLLAIGLAPPLLCTFEPLHARRFVLLALPFYLLAAAGLDALARLLPGRAGAQSIGALALLAAMTTATAPNLQATLRHVTHTLHPTPEPLARLASACRLARREPVMTSRALTRLPFVVGQRSVAPAVQFLTDAFMTGVALGLDVYPVFPRHERLHFCLGQGEWLPVLREAFPEGRVTTWADPSDTGRSLRLYTVPGAAAWRRQGLRLSVESVPAAGRPPELLVARLDAPGLSLPPGGRCRWSGALYVPASGPRVVLVEGRGTVSLQVGALSTGPSEYACRLSTWFSEGWHDLSLAAATGSEESEPPELLWSNSSGAPLAPIPPENFLRHLPENPLSRAPQLGSPLLALSRCDARFWDNPRIAELLQDLVVTGERIYLVRAGRGRVLAVGPDGARLPGWLGLRDQQGRPIELPATGGAPRFLYALAATPEGRLFVSDALAGAVHFARRDGLVERTVQLIRGRQEPTAMHFDRASRTLLVADHGLGQILRFDEAGTARPPWPCPGVTAICTSPDGRRTYAVVPRMGGIAVLSDRGRQLAFWRAVDLSGLSRLDCDEQGRVFVLADHGRLLGFDPEGRIILPAVRIPNPVAPWETGGEAFLAAIHARGKSELLLGLSGNQCGFVTVRLSPALPGTPPPEGDFRELPPPDGPTF